MSAEQHIEELRRQRDVLQKQVDELSLWAKRVPTMISMARIDAQEGKPTKFNYDELARLTAPRR